MLYANPVRCVVQIAMGQVDERSDKFERRHGNVVDYGPSQVRDYDPEKIKSAVRASIQEITPFSSRVSGLEFVEKGILRLIGLIQEKYLELDEVGLNLNVTGKNVSISWATFGRVTIPVG